MGFADDYLKITRRAHDGMSPRMKIVGQLLIALGVGAAVLVLAQQNPPLSLPGVRRLRARAWSNAVNLTDGLDGLAISTFAVAAAAFTALAYVTGHAVLADYLLLVVSSRGGAHGLLRRPGGGEPRGSS